MDRVMDLRKKGSSPKVQKKELSTKDNRVLNYMAVYSTVGDLIDIIEELKDKERIISELEDELGYQKRKPARFRQAMGHYKLDLEKPKQDLSEPKQELLQPKPESSPQKLSKQESGVPKPKSPQSKRREVTASSPDTKPKSPLAKRRELLSPDSKETRPKSPQTKRKEMTSPLNDRKDMRQKSPQIKRKDLTAGSGDSKDMKKASQTVTKSPKKVASSPKLTKRIVEAKSPPRSPEKSLSKPTEKQQEPSSTSPTPAQSTAASTEESQLPPVSPRQTSPKKTPRKVHPGVVDPRLRRKRWNPSDSFSDTLEVVHESGDDSLSLDVSQYSSLASASIDPDVWTTAEADERYKLLMKEHLDLEKAFSALHCDGELPLDPLTMIQERYQLEQDLLSAQSQICKLEQQILSRPRIVQEDGNLKRDKFHLLTRNRHLQSKVGDLESKLMSLEEALSESHEEIEDWEFRVLELEQELATSTPRQIEMKRKEVEAVVKKTEDMSDLNYVDKWAHVSSELKAKGIDIREVMKQLEELRTNAACASSDQEKITLLEAHKIMNILDKYSHKRYERVQIVPSFTVLSMSEKSKAGLDN